MKHIMHTWQFLQPNDISISLPIQILSENFHIIYYGWSTQYYLSISILLPMIFQGITAACYTASHEVQ